MSQFEVCVQAIESVGCQVTTEERSVKVRFPADPDDPGAAPDGEEREYNKPYFMLLITRVFIELAEQSIIDDNGRPVEGGENGS